MTFNGCSSLSEYLLRLVIRKRQVRSVSALSIQIGVERCHLLHCAHHLERDGKIVISRQYRNGPLTLSPNPKYHPHFADQAIYQMSFWPKGF